MCTTRLFTARDTDGSAHGLSTNQKKGSRSDDNSGYFAKSKEWLLSYRDNVDEENTKESTKVAEEVLNANLKTKVIEK